MSVDKPVSLKNIVSENKAAIAINLLLLVVEIAVMALVPLFIGFAIDGLLAKNTQELQTLVILLLVLVLVSVVRRFYDTRAYGKIRVKVQRQIAERSTQLPTSVLNARLDMARELVDFLEQHVPDVLNALVQFVVSVTVLYFLDSVLAQAAVIAAVLMMLIYAAFHSGFYNLNRALNSQTEKQVTILQKRSSQSLKKHFTRLMRLEIKLSDREAILYGTVFIVLLSMVVFNLWHATSFEQITAGTIFSIVSYSWEFVESAVMLPITLQSLTRLTEITARINTEKE